MQEILVKFLDNKNFIKTILQLLSMVLKLEK